MTPWIGVDLDGTLAMHKETYELREIGAPVPAMVDRVKRWLREGRDVRIVTARVHPDYATAEDYNVINDWAIEHIGQQLPITCSKDYAMVELWDDRAIRVIRNTGERSDYARIAPF